MTLFLLRAKQFTSQTFVIVKAEELRGKHLEAVIRFLSNHDNKLLGVRLHCVQCKSSSLQPSAWVESKRWEESALESVASAWKHLIVDGTRVETACIVTSESSGTGKTAWIRMQKRSEGQVGSITIHERSTPDKLADDLMSKFTEEAGEKFVHFSFTYLPKPSSNASSQWLESMNQFFFSLLVLGTIYSHVSSRSLHSYKAKWNIYIELPAGIITDVAIPNWLRVYLPILSLSCELESPPHDFMIDEDTRRVCTYLRAYENGTIDRKYEKRCRKCILFVIDRSGSMGLDAGHGESRLAIATNCALRIFDSHLQDDDVSVCSSSSRYLKHRISLIFSLQKIFCQIVGVTMFDDLVETVVQTQAIRDEAHKSELRRDMDSMRDQSRNGTYMYLALAAALHSASNSHQEIETWIICLTDGQTADKDATFRPNLQRSCANIHVVLVGVGLQPAYETKMRDLCNKYQPPNRSRTKGFYVSSEANAESMSNAFATVAKGIPVSQTFELDGRVSDDECRRLIRKYAPEFITDDNMQLIEFWIRFLFRRVSVLDANESYNYNEDMEGLGSKLFELMLFEIKRLIGNNHSRDWINNNYSQLIYDFTKPDAPEFRLLCTSPSNLDQETRRKYESMDLPGFNIPNEEQLKEHSTLCWLLSRSMDIPLNGDGRLHCIEEHGFVLTLDFTIKLLNFHERVACKVPCILEGETGVSKTGLTKMYSILRNSSQSARATESTHADLNEIEEEIRGLGFDIGEGNDSLVRLESALQAEAEATIGDSTELAARLRALISHKCAQRSPLFQDQPEKLSNDKTVSVLELLQWFASATLKKTFFEINVDSSMDENAVLEMFKPILRTAKRLSEVGALIVVFFDGKISQ